MDEKQLIEILNILKKELSLDLEDPEYIMYLEEKIKKAYIKAKERNLSKDEFISLIKKEIPTFLNNYQMMKKRITESSSSENLNFGISINFELIDLFQIADTCDTNVEFITLRDKYFKYLKSDPRFQNFDYIFPGLKDITLEEIKNIRKNILENVDYITPEWSGKMRMNIDSRKQLIIDGKINDSIFDFTYLEKIATFARANNMKIRLHNIIWHSQFPYILEKASKEEILLFLDTYMQKLNESFGDIIYSIDVLNEIAFDQSDELLKEEDKKEKVLRDSPWKDKLGEEYYIDILRLAKKNFGNIPLVYNEYGEERKDKRKNVIAIVNRIKEVEQQENITLLDILGIQSHYSNQTLDEDIKDAYEDYSKLGKELQVTELDVSHKENESSIDLQTNRVFRTVLDNALYHGVKLINIWGVTSKISWKSTKINNFLDDKGNITIYIKKFLDCYSQKHKNNLKQHNDIKKLEYKNPYNNSGIITIIQVIAIIIGFTIILAIITIYSLS